MPFAWNQTAPPRIGQVDAWDVPLNKWLGVRFAHGSDYTLGQAVNDFTEDTIYDGPDKMSPELANKVWGIPGFLKFEEPVSIQRAALMRGRKELELERLAYLEGASHKWFHGKAIAGFAAGVVGGFSHPLDAATAFIPFVGSEAKAAALAKMGGGTLRQALARGIFTEESLKWGRLTTAMVDGVLSQAFVELPVAFEKARNQAEYTAEESAINILGGGVFAGGIHLTARGIAALWKRAGEMHSRLNPETRDAIFREQERAFVEGDKPATVDIIRIDESAIRERVRFDEEAAFAEAERIVSREAGQPQAANATELLHLAQAEAARGTPGGKILARLVERFKEGERTVPVLEQIARLVDRAYDPTRIGPQEALAIERVFGPATQPAEATRATLKKARGELFETERVLEDLLKRLHTADDQLARQLRANIHNLQLRRAEIVAAIEKADTTLKRHTPLTREEIAEHRAVLGERPDLIEKAQSEKAKRVADLVAAKKAEHEASLAGRIDAERTAEIARQQAEGKILPPEEIKKYAASQVPKAAEITAVKEDIATLEAELKQRALTPEEQASVAAELKAIDDEVYTDQVKQIRAAVPCVGKVQL